MKLFDAPHIDLESFQFRVAAFIWQKRQRLELIKTILPVALSNNPDEAQKLVDEYIKEVAPFFEEEEKQRYNRLAKTLEEEAEKTYVAIAADAKPRKIKKKQQKERPQRRRVR